MFYITKSYILIALSVYDVTIMLLVLHFLWQNRPLYITAPGKSSGPSQIGPDVNRRAEFPIPSLWAKLLEEIRLGHSSAERRPGIADVKNGVTSRVRSGLSVTELGNFCSREHPLREVINNHFSEILGYGFQDLGFQLWGLDFHTRGFQDRNLKTFRT